MGSPMTSKPAVQSSSSPTSKKWIGIVLLIIILLILMIWIDSNGVAPPVTANPECPHQQHDLELPANTTSIPEFHDCQKLINTDGATYGTLAAVFAREGLGDIVFPSVAATVTITPPPSGGGSTVSFGITTGGGGISLSSSASDSAVRANAIAIAEIKSYDGPYDPLGVGKDRSCLYIVKLQPSKGSYQYSALMVQKGGVDTGCANPGAPRTGGKWLKVNYSTRQASEPPYPPVARWDWSPATKKQFISILCAPDWCEVGDWDLPPLVPRVVSITAQPEKATWEQKGRYDEQRLALTTGTNPMAPSDVMATAVPDSHLADYTLDSFKQFVPVARTVLPSAMEVYQRKFNYGPGSVPDKSNQVSLCSGWRFHCLPLGQAIATMLSLRCWKSDDGKIWWARIEGTDGSVEYRCVTRRLHSGVTPPAAARWRWKMKDEGLWTRCELGCCEVEEK